jgi:hypothetical protein
LAVAVAVSVLFRRDLDNGDYDYAFSVEGKERLRICDNLCFMAKIFSKDRTALRE